MVLAPVPIPLSNKLGVNALTLNLPDKLFLTLPLASLAPSILIVSPIINAGVAVVPTNNLPLAHVVPNKPKLTAPVIEPVPFTGITIPPYSVAVVALPHTNVNVLGPVTVITVSVVTFVHIVWLEAP